MTKLNIIYPNGTMLINVENFLDFCGVTKFRKLLKVIKMSYTPGVYTVQLENYINDYLNTVEVRRLKAKTNADIKQIERNIKNFNKYLELLKDV
jgi:hypothetical protein